MGRLCAAPPTLAEGARNGAQEGFNVKRSTFSLVLCPGDGNGGVITAAESKKAIWVRAPIPLLPGEVERLQNHI